MARGRPPGPRRLRPAQQSAMIMARWPGFQLLRRGRRYVWEGTLKPTALSSVYTIRISCADWDQSRVFVMDPLLQRRAEADIPHRYADGSLCLNIPGPWSREQYIADTLIPWASLWLHHYETWRITGEWLGGGEHPATPALPTWRAE